MLLNFEVDLIEHLLIVMYEVKVIGKDGCYPLTVSDAADQLVAALDLSMNVDSGGGNFVHLVKIRVVFIEAAPKL